MLTSITFYAIISNMNNKEITKEFLSIKQFAEKVGLHPHTIRNYIRNGCLNAFQIGPSEKSPYRIPISEFQRIAEFNLQSVVDEIIKKRNE
ncbi:MAG TPA: helix-turn-helix domain-containing protein [Candidatus Nitrosopolaris rasttigaisensis]|nr:helix-turn-helix domain-containing protein [Candidatus Nitrosopolaris rasttigaisensis]